MGITGEISTILLICRLCDRAQLFAGAGIVKGSNPEKELAEVQLKLQTLLRAIHVPGGYANG